MIKRFTMASEYSPSVLIIRLGVCNQALNSCRDTWHLNVTRNVALRSPHDGTTRTWWTVNGTTDLVYTHYLARYNSKTQYTHKHDKGKLCFKGCGRDEQKQCGQVKLSLKCETRHGGWNLCVKNKFKENLITYWKNSPFLNLCNHYNSRTFKMETYTGSI